MATDVRKITLEEIIAIQICNALISQANTAEIIDPKHLVEKAVAITNEILLQLEPATVGAFDTELLSLLTRLQEMSDCLCITIPDKLDAIVEALPGMGGGGG